MAKHYITIKPMGLLNCHSRIWDGRPDDEMQYFMASTWFSLICALLTALSSLLLWNSRFRDNLIVSLLAYASITCLVICLYFAFSVGLRILDGLLNWNKIATQRFWNGLANTYLWSLRSAIRCTSPAGIAIILGGLIDQLDEAGVGNCDSYKYGRNGETWGFPDVARLRSAKILADEVASKHQAILQLGNSAALAQSIEVVRQMLRSENVWFGEEKLRFNIIADKVFWFSWSDEDQAAYEESLLADDAAHLLDNENHAKTKSYTNSMHKPTNPSAPAENQLHQQLIPQVSLTFPAFLDFNPSVRFLQLEEQQLEYRRYLSLHLSGKESDSGLKQKLKQQAAENSRNQEAADLDIW